MIWRILIAICCLWPLLPASAAAQNHYEWFYYRDTNYVYSLQNGAVQVVNTETVNRILSNAETLFLVHPIHLTKIATNTGIISNYYAPFNKRKSIYFHKYNYWHLWDEHTSLLLNYDKGTVLALPKQYDSIYTLMNKQYLLGQQANSFDIIDSSTYQVIRHIPQAKAYAYCWITDNNLSEFELYGVFYGDGMIHIVNEKAVLVKSIKHPAKNNYEVMAALEKIYPKKVQYEVALNNDISYGVASVDLWLQYAITSTHTIYHNEHYKATIQVKSQYKIRSFEMNRYEHWIAIFASDSDTYKDLPISIIKVNAKTGIVYCPPYLQQALGFSIEQAKK